MNKIQNINLGGVPFVIDIEAFDLLEEYLESIENHFSRSDGFDEITSDIEARLSELFTEGLGKRKIVTIPDVKDAISIMGVPEEFSAESDYYEEMEGGGYTSRSYRTGKKLFRDIDNKKVAGVASGLAAYFGLESATWVRVAFVLLTFFGGPGLILYIILWVITPEALSSSDRLQMRGERINVSNMARIIEEELTDFAEDISQMTGSKKKEVDENDVLEQVNQGFKYAANMVVEVISGLVSTIHNIVHRLTVR